MLAGSCLAIFGGGSCGIGLWAALVGALFGLWPWRLGVTSLGYRVRSLGILRVENGGELRNLLAYPAKFPPSSFGALTVKAKLSPKLAAFGLALTQRAL